MKNASLIRKWNKKLKDAGLSMERGRNRNTVYVGNMTNLELAENYTLRNPYTTGGGRRVRPEGHGPDE